jgi:divalent metal cation (Fe/Co/Zn/Cd) transporter
MKYHVDLHLEVDPDMTVRKSHDIATTVRFAVIHRLPWVADVLVHVEPSPLREAVASAHSASRRVHGK